MGCPIRRSAPGSSSARGPLSGICATCSPSSASSPGEGWRTHWPAPAPGWPRPDLKRREASPGSNPVGNPGSRPRVFDRRGAGYKPSMLRLVVTLLGRESHMSAPTKNPAGATAVRPFTIPVTPEAELEALRARVAATRWPDRELVTDHSQGPKLAVMQELARYWATEY